jgi:diadenylate cyclase
VIIRRGKVAAAACFLPLTTNPELASSLGTRHRAAIGITEESDCMAIVVSEISGHISIAVAGSIDQGVSLDRLRLRMNQHFGPVVAEPHGKPLALEGTSGKSNGEPVGDLATTPTSASEGD